MNGGVGRFSGWLVARGGVSRLALLATAAGIGFGGLRPQPDAPWIAGTCVAALFLAGTARPALRRPRHALGSTPPGWGPILVIVLALAVGVTVGSLRTTASLDGELARSARASGVSGEWFNGRVVVTGVPAERGRSIVVKGRSLGPVGVGEDLLLEITQVPSGEPLGSSGRADLGALTEGSILLVEGRLRAPEGPDPGAGSGGFDEAGWLRRMGIAAVLSVSARDVTPAGSRTGLAGALDRLRSRARERLEQGLDPAMAGLLRGFILGDKSGIPRPTLEAFRRAGTAHLLAVSGLHVGSLAAVVLVAGRALGAAPWLRTAAAGATAAGFMLFTGAGPSVVRATVMVIVVLGAGLAGRGRDGWSALALAAIVVLAREPPVVAAAGFQLSFSAVASLLLLARPLETALSRRLPAAAATAVGVSLAASLGTAPVSLLTFGQVSLVGVAANPLVVPVVPLAMALGMASIVVGSVWPAASALLNVGAGTVIGWVAVVSTAFAAAPVLTREGVLVFLAAVLGALGAWFAWRRNGARRLDAVWGGGRGRGRLQATAALVVLTAGAVSSVGLVSGTGAAVAHVELWWAARSWPSGGEIRVLDVGEGAAVLVRSPSGATVLIDAGPPGGEMAADLRRLGVGRLDALVVTHPHADHYGGLEDVIGEGAPRLLVDHVLRSAEVSTTDDEVGPYAALQGAAVSGGSRHLVPTPGEAVEIADVRLDFLVPPGPLAPRAAGGWGVAGVGWEGAAAPSGEGVALTSGRVNQASLVVVVHMEGLAILVPGDAEADALARYLLPDVDALVVPHHGSEGAVTESLLDRITPAVAVVPVGAGNTFGHPAADTVGLLREWGVALFRTDHSGWVALRPAAGGSIEVAAER